MKHKFKIGKYYIPNPFIMFVSIYNWLFMVNYDPNMTDITRREFIVWRVIVVMFVVFMLSMYFWQR